MGPYVSANSANFGWRSVPRNGRYPKNGTPRGPGGNGAVVWFRLLNKEKKVRAAITMTSSVAVALGIASSASLASHDHGQAPPESALDISACDDGKRTV